MRRINDSSEGDAGLSKAKDTVRTLVREIRAKTGAEILFRTPNPVVYGYWQPLPPDAKPGEPYEAGTYATSAFAAALVDLAHELDCPVCDHYSAWKRKKYQFGHPGANPQGLRLRMGDTVHPNAVGHLAFFRELVSFFDVPKYFPWEEVE
jgi:lysophospholipase L1-like esterase